MEQSSPKSAGLPGQIYSTVDQWELSHDFVLASTSIEIQVLASGTLKSFTSALTGGVAYALTSIGGTSWVTLNSGSPDLTSGTGANKGNPILAGSKEYFIAVSGSTILKALTGDSGVTLVLAKASSVGL